MPRFWIVVYTITALAHAPFALALAFALTRLGAPLPWLSALAIASALVVALRGRVARARWDVPLSRARLLLLEEPYYVHLCAAIAGAAAFAPVALALIMRRVLGGGGALGPALGAAALGCHLAALALSFYGVVVRRRWVRVRTMDVPIAGLDAAFDGYRIAQASDLHIGGLLPPGLGERWARIVNRLDVDLVAVTGDYVTTGVAFHADIARVVTAMRGRDGVIAVMGNHDYFGDGEPLLTLLRGGGVTVLRNERTTIARGGGALVIAGVDDTYSRRADVARALVGRPSRSPLIALAHDPQLFPELARAGASLVLSGHTHWGQVALPFFATRVNLARRAYRYHAGLYRIGASTLWIHPGLGTTGPPIRIGVAPEITVLRLVATPASPGGPADLQP